MVSIVCKGGKLMGECTHVFTEYIPAEEDIGVKENLICLDCGKNLPLEREED